MPDTYYHGATHAHPLVGIGLLDGEVAAVVADGLLQHAQQPRRARAPLHCRYQLRARPRECQQRAVRVPCHPQAAATHTNSALTKLVYYEYTKYNIQLSFQLLASTLPLIVLACWASRLHKFAASPQYIKSVLQHNPLLSLYFAGNIRALSPVAEPVCVWVADVPAPAHKGAVHILHQLRIA